MSWEFRRKIKNIILAFKIDSKRKVLFSLLFPNQSVIAFDSRNQIKFQKAASEIGAGSPLLHFFDHFELSLEAYSEI